MSLLDLDDDAGKSDDPGSTLLSVPLNVGKCFEKVSLRHPIGYIVINGEEIDEETSLNFEKQFRQCEMLPVDTIMISIHSSGGCVYSALRIIDIMSNSEKKIITVCSGCCMSAAALLFSQGDVRFMSKTATIMVHDASIGMAEGNLQDVECEAVELRRLTERGYSMMSRAIGKKDNWFLKRCGRNVDKYIDCEEALKINLATHEGVPKMNCSVELTIDYTVKGVPIDTSTKKTRKRKRTV